MTEPIDYAASGLREGLIHHGGVVVNDSGGEALKRLNVVLPHFHKAYAFGGVLSAMQAAAALTREYEAVRFVSMYPLGEQADMFDFASFVHDAPRKRIEVARACEGDLLPCHEREVFFCTYWTTALLWREYVRQLAAAGKEPRPFYYLIQDYEPGFYPMGCKQTLALSTYEHPDLTHAIFNSASLAEHFGRLGYDFAEKYVLPPSLNPDIHAHLDARGHKLAPKDDGKIRILVYGRPEQPRNCFAAIMEGLFRYFSEMSEAERAGYEIISAGQPHDDIRLAPGAVVKSVGKLSMPDYIRALETSHIGLAFMASPHPSYPPLEMALFGLYTITTSYGAKDMRGVHPNLRALSEPTPIALAEELGRGAEKVRAGEVKTGEAILPTCMSPLGWEENMQKLEIKKL